MNKSTYGDTSFKGIKNTNTTSIHKTAEQIYSVSTTYTKCGLPVTTASKATILNYLFSNRVYDIENSSLFIDTRKQQIFDWQKNTNAYQRIIHLSDLEDKWDGYDAPKFSKEQIDLALNLYSNIRTYCISRGLDFLKVEPFIAPCSNGMILFEWAGQRFPGRQLEIYIPVSAEDKLEYLKTEGNSDIEAELHLEELYSVLNWLFKFDC